MSRAAAAPILADRRGLAAMGVALGLLASIALFAGLGGPQGFVEGLAWVLMLLARAGAAPAAYILAAVGLGRLALPLFRGSRDEWALQLAVGVALMLSLSHALGIFRMFGGAAGHLVAMGVVVAGIGLLAHQLLAGGAMRNASMVLPLSALPGFVGAALMVVAACNPPGWLWESEFGGFDALEYHLELPQEWLARGWLWPVSHNVYSYLPGYVESAYLHLGAFLGGVTAPTPASPMIGLLSGDGAGVLSCQLLHAGLTVCAGVLVGRATRLAAERCGLSAREASLGGGLAASLFLLTPWTIVVGSLAYNEAGMTLLGAGALAAALDDRLPAVRRGLLAGLLVGVACGAKPTALPFIGVPVGIVLLGAAPRREWWKLVLAGSVAGGAALAPWLVRNWYACGNPVFPFAAWLFGSGHWTAEQVGRYAGAHQFQGSLGERFSLMFLPERSNAPGAAVGENRGLFHIQWFVFFPICLAAVVAAMVRRSTRRVALLIGLGMAFQLGFWLFRTHIQSRFLIPMTVTGSVVVGLAAAWLAQSGSAKWPSLRSTVVGLALAAQGLCAVLIYAGQHGGRPNAHLVNNALGGVHAFSGDAVRAAREELASYSEADRRAAIERMPPMEFLAFVAPPGARVYLLGDAAFLYFRPPFIGHTTWDTSPLGLAMRADPGDPARWVAKLRAEGIDMVLLNMSELERYRKSGWYDPDVTPEAAAEWMRTQGTLIRSWPETGQALFSIAPARPAAGGQGAGR